MAGAPANPHVCVLVNHSVFPQPSRLGSTKEQTSWSFSLLSSQPNPWKLKQECNHTASSCFLRESTGAPWISQSAILEIPSYLAQCQGSRVPYLGGARTSRSLPTVPGTRQRYEKIPARSKVHSCELRSLKAETAAVK